MNSLGGAAMLGCEVSSSSLTPLASRVGALTYPFGVWVEGRRTQREGTGQGLYDWPCGKLGLCSLTSWIFKAVSSVGLFHGFLGDSHLWPLTCRSLTRWMFSIPTVPSSLLGRLQLLPCWSLSSPLKLTVWGQVISDPKAGFSHPGPSAHSQRMLRWEDS